MKVVEFINQNPNINYEVDGVLYNSEKDIPSSIKNMEVKSYIYTMVDIRVLKLRTEKTHTLNNCIDAYMEDITHDNGDQTEIQ